MIYWSCLVSLPTTNHFLEEVKNCLVEDSTVHVSLKLYDICGHLLHTLVDEVKEAGRYNVFWDGRNDRGIRSQAAFTFTE